jgi:hypothetical protein
MLVRLSTSTDWMGSGIRSGVDITSQDFVTHPADLLQDGLTSGAMEWIGKNENVSPRAETARNSARVLESIPDIVEGKLDEHWSGDMEKER